MPIIELQKCDDMCIRLYTIPALDERDGQTDGMKFIKQYHGLRADER